MAIIVWYLYRPLRTTNGRAVKPPRLNALSGLLYRYPFSRQRFAIWLAPDGDLWCCKSNWLNANAPRRWQLCARARMSDIKKLSVAQWPARVRFLTGNDVARMHAMNVEQNNLFILPSGILCHILRYQRKVSFFSCTLLKVRKLRDTSLDDSAMQCNGGLFWVELKSRREAPINEKFEGRAPKRARRY